jgi:hypothetical protein
MTYDNQPLTPNTSESNFTLPDYGLEAPEDNARAHEIANADPVASTRGPVSLVDGGNIRFPATVPLTALPDRFRTPIEAQLRNLPDHRRAAEEPRLIAEALRQNSLQLRVKAGAGEGANPYQQEVFQLARDRQQLEQEAWRLETELAEVVRWDNVTDPATGKATPVPVEAVQGEARKAKQGRIDEIGRHLKQLEGIEGQRRLQKAMKLTLEAEKAQREQLADNAEADRRARELVREERINKQAQARARMLRPNVG